jgi:hypothetical protein
MKTLRAAFALSAMLGTALAAAPPPPSPAPAASPTLDLFVAICKLPPDQVQRALAALPDNARPAAILVCIGYQRGQLDLLHMLQGQPAARKSI